MQKTTGKRLVLLLLTMALLVSSIPAAVRSASASENATEVATETPSNRTTIYISASGSEWFAGTEDIPRFSAPMVTTARLCLPSPS